MAFFGIFWPFLTLLLPDIMIQIWNLNFLAIFILINTLFKNCFWKCIKNALPTSVQGKLTNGVKISTLPHHKLWHTVMTLHWSSKETIVELSHLLRKALDQYKELEYFWLDLNCKFNQVQTYVHFNPTSIPY